MTRLLPWLALLAWLGVAGPAAAQKAKAEAKPQLPDARVLLEKAAEATGGPYPQNLVARGEANFVPMNMSGTFVERFSRTGQVVTRYELRGVGTMEEGTDGDIAWEKNPFAGIRILNGREREIRMRQYALQSGQVIQDIYSRVETIGQSELRGRKQFKIALYPDKGKPDTFYVDAETHLPSRLTMEHQDPVSGADAVLTVDLLEWKAVGKRMEPHRCDIQIGPIRVETRYLSFEYPDKHPDGTFDLPPDVARQAQVESEPEKIGSLNGYEIQRKELKEQPTLTIRRWVKHEEVSQALADILPKAYIRAMSGGKMGGAPFCIIHEMKDDKMDIEAGVPLLAALDGVGEIKASQLPAGKVLVTWHVGPYHELGKAHEALQAWAEKNELEVNGSTWEVYWTDPGEEPDPSKWRTEVLLPIK